MVIGIYERNFPVTPGSTSIGINTTRLIRDVLMFGVLYVLTARSIALLGLYPLFMFSRAASMKTITVSMPDQNAKIRLKFVKKFSVIPIRSSTINVMKNAMIIPSVAMSDCLSPMKSAVIAKTRSTELTAFDPSDL